MTTKTDNGLSLSSSLSLNACRVARQGPFSGHPSSCEAVTLDERSRRPGVRRKDIS